MHQFQSDWGFGLKWVAGTIAGWVVGMLAAILFSELAVNLVYPKETNLIVGVCLGAAVSLSQKFAVRRQIMLSRNWIWGATIGIGTPFGLDVLLDELGYSLSETWFVLLLVGGGAICGLLQAPSLNSRSSRKIWWVLTSMLSWSLAWIISRIPGIATYLLGGAFLGVVSCGMFLWLREQPQSTSTV